MKKHDEIKRELLAYVEAYKNGTKDREYIQKQINFYYNNYRYMDGKEILDMLDDIDKRGVKKTKAINNMDAFEKTKVEIQEEIPIKKQKIDQGVSVVAINVLSENDIAHLVQQEVNKEITKLNAQGKRVIDVTTSISAKNIVGMKLHAVLLWESDK